MSFGISHFFVISFFSLHGFRMGMDGYMDGWTGVGKAKGQAGKGRFFLSLRFIHSFSWVYMVARVLRVLSLLKEEAHLVLVTTG